MRPAECFLAQLSIHEIFDEFNEPWEADILIPRVEVVDGYISVPERPASGWN